MNEISSGCYTIDSEYNVISVNETARTIYPQLRTGEKCYKCLLGGDAPCGPCPVAAGRRGPHTYVDPIRGIMETVDAVELELEGHGTCYSMIFSTVGNEAEFAATLPTSSDDLRKLALIKALTVDYYDVFSVDLEEDVAVLYRHDGRNVDSGSIYQQRPVYSQALENYVVHYVHPEDQDMVRHFCSIARMKEVLHKEETAVVHYRVLLGGRLRYFYRKIVRIGEAENYSHVVIGVGCEDDEIRLMQEHDRLQKDLSIVEYDSLTGLLTREAFHLRSPGIMAAHPDARYDFCILKIENLGLINHQYGRPSGDRLLRLIGRLLKLRKDDTNCIAYCRDGTFVSVTMNTPSDIRYDLIQGFKQEILHYSSVKDLSLKWAIWKRIPQDISIEEVHARTQFALNTILADIHRDYVEFDQAMIDRMDWENTVLTGFEDALGRGEFKAWYQPKYAISTGRIVGAEALVRWFRPDGSMISPDRYIPILENRQLINRLDENIFRQVCQFQQRLAGLGFEGLPISVNLSRASLFTRDVAATYARIADSYQVLPSVIPIEITESAAVRSASIREFATDLIDRGFALHMDDFGSGYSSLASLQTIPFEAIKLDKTLIDFIGRASGENLLKHTIAFAKESGKTVVAEGVENLEQYMFLKFAGCDIIQGFYFSRPVDGETFLRMLREDKPS